MPLLGEDDDTTSPTPSDREILAVPDSGFGRADDLLAARREAWAIALAILVIALPHVIGAPAAPHEASVVPAALAASFAANSLAANAIFWSCIGLFLGLALDRYAKDMDTA